MKRWWCATLLVCLTSAVGRPLGAVESWTGVISDSACGPKHEEAAEGAEKMPDRDCTLVCVHGGSKYVLVADNGTIYKIANQDFAELPAKAGRAVKVTGDLKADAITVTQIESK